MRLRNRIRLLSLSKAPRWPFSASRRATKRQESSATGLTPGRRGWWVVSFAKHETPRRSREPSGRATSESIALHQRQRARVVGAEPSQQPRGRRVLPPSRVSSAFRVLDCRLWRLNHLCMLTKLLPRSKAVSGCVNRAWSALRRTSALVQRQPHGRMSAVYLTPVGHI